MNEIKCPHCQKAFKVDEAGFADIVKQVRDAEFARELHERVELLERDKQNAVKLAEEKTKNELQADAAKKDAQIAELRTEKEAKIAELEANKQLAVSEISQRKDEELAELKAKLATIEAENKLSITKVVNDLQTEASKKEAELAELKNLKESEVSALKAERATLIAELKAEKDAEIARLSAQIVSAATEKQLAVTEAVNKVEKERDELANKLTSKDTEQKLLESSLKDKYETQLKDRDDTIERLKEMKAKLSVKLIGETLEQHCQNEFNSVRASVFPHAYFEKDNEAIKEEGEVKGTKGDYVYRDYESQGGAEIISIMFEMKDEQDVSSNKRTVESHLEKLDKDRKKKGLEYAVLVTLLEADNELYNRGIVDVSYKYDKMFVVRPQFFLPLISLLKNANMKSAEDRRQLIAARNSNIDITNFENDLQSFQDGFMKNVKDSSNKFKEAMDGIDATIKKLEGVKEALRLSNKHLLTAGNKVETVSVKRLTKNNPTMAAKFGELQDLPE